jgi:hypothetical protein
VDTSVVDGPTTFVDTFDGAASGRAADYGLNDSRRQRQPAVTSSGYARISGYPDHDRPPDPSRSRVNDPAYPNRLSFHGGPSAVRLDKPATADLRGVYTIEAVVDPVVGHGHKHGRGWVSLALSAAATRNGSPARPGTDLGLVVRSTGHAQLYQNGVPTWDDEPRTRPARDGSFRVTVTVAADEARLVTVTVNGTTRTVRTAAAMPRTAYLSLGSYANDPSVVSTVDGLRVTPLGGLGYYGHFGSAHPESPNDGVDHTYELVRFTNLNQYLAGPETGFLDRCRPRSCIVYAGWQQFDGATLRPDAIAQLEILKATIGSNIDKVAAIDLVDEPYARGISVEDLTTAVRQVGAAFPGLTRILVLDGPTITNRPMPVPTEVDWVGFDWYCVGRDRLLSTLGLLEAQLDRYQRTFLMPEAAVVNECPGWDDQRIAAEQDVYLDIAEARPRIAYLMSFGWWFAPRYGGNMDPLATLPLTVAAQRRIGGSVIGLRCPPDDERAP